MLQFQSQESEKKQLNPENETVRILLVDDNAELREVLKQLLELEGYEVDAVASAELALLSLSKETPDMIICDIMMPETDGFTFHEEVRYNPGWCSIPFLFLTALSSDEDVRVGKTLGCDDYLTKPFDPEDLVAVVKGKLALARNRRTMEGVKMEGYRRRIIHTLSHEFRTPLVSINTGAELLLEAHSSLSEDQVVRLLESLWRGGQRLERLVDDFMLLQQIDLGHAAHTCELYRRPVSIAELVGSAVSSFRDSFLHGEANEIKVVECDRKIADLQVDVYDVQVASAITRLLSNAQKFGGLGKPIVVSVKTYGSAVEIIVRDYGKGLGGLTEKSAEEACQAFQQINRDTDEQQGCGLGLTIAKYFTRINGGKLLLRPPADSLEGLEAVISFSLAE